MITELATYVRRITTWDELAALEPAWNELAGDAPLLTWDWLATWWKHYGSVRRRSRDLSQGAQPERQLYVLAVYDEQPSSFLASPENVLVGIAPWYIEHTLVKGNVVRWLGSGEVCTDHLSLICREEDRSRVAAAIADALLDSVDEWDQLELAAVDADDAAVAELVAQLEAAECHVSWHEGDACWALDLPANWEDYLAAISKSHRKQLRQLERRVLESARVQWHRAETRADFAAGWPLLVDLHQRRRRSLGEPGCFASQTFADFHHEAAARLLDRGQLRLSWLELDGTPAAAEYHLASHTTTFAYQGGVDPDRLEDEPGRLSTILCLRQAIEEGHGSFDFLRGDEPYKAHWRATPRPTVDYRIVANRRLSGLRGRMMDFTETVADWLRQAVRS